VVAVALVLPGGVAVAYWSAPSAAGGGGSSAATSVNPGNVPTVSVSQGDVSVAWPASTLASSVPVAGYVVRRYDAATLTPQSVLGSCAGRQLGTSCTEEGVPAGQWRYSVTPLMGTAWTGPESELSEPATTDTTAPVNALSLSDVTGAAVRSGPTVYYRGAASGSFTLTNALTDAGSGPADSQTSVLTGDTSGWTHAPSTVSTPAAGPYVSSSFAWASATTGSVTQTVRGHDLAGNEAATSLSYVDDSAAPTGAMVSYPHGYQPASSVVVTLGDGSDAGAGIADRRLQRSVATAVAGSCGVQGAFVDVGPPDPGSPYTDQDVADGTCYRYRYVVTDRLGNQAVATSDNTAMIDSSYGGPPLRSASGYSVLGGTGVTSTLATTVSGDLGLSTSGLIAGFPPGIVAGRIEDKDPAAARAQVDLGLAYADAAARVPADFFSGDQAGATFHPGVYRTLGAFANSGTMTLDGDGDPHAVFVFQIDAAMDAAASSRVLLVGGATAAHVYWQVNGAVTIGADAAMAGTVMAAGAITLGSGVVLIGRALATAAVTMAANTVRFTIALPPTLTINGAGQGGSTDLTKDTTPTLTGTSNAGAGATVTLRVADQTLTTAVLGDGTWSLTAGVLGAGSWPVVAGVRDTAGNNTSATQLLKVEVNPAPVSLATASSYSVLGGSGVTATGSTTLEGDLGLSPSGAITGLPPASVGGSVHDKDQVAAQARMDLMAAYDELDARVPHETVVGDLGGQTLHAGIYHKATALGLTGTLTLDAQDDPSAVFIFQGDAALDTAASAQVVLVRGAQADHVYWQVEGAVGTGASTAMVGTIITAGAITLGAGTRLVGRALSAGAVTMASSAVRFTATSARTVAEGPADGASAVPSTAGAGPGEEPGRGDKPSQTGQGRPTRCDARHRSIHWDGGPRSALHAPRRGR
jgi:ice-binding like protein/Big-like domain-containing protein